MREVYQKVEAECDCNLSNIDSRYVEDTYTDLLLQLWFTEGVENIVSCFSGMLNLGLGDPKLILDLIEDLNVTNTFEDCFHNLDNSTFIVHLMKLHESSKRLQKEEGNIINTFKQKCLKELKNLTKNIKNELSFLNTFVESMKSSEHLEDLFKNLKIKQLISTNDTSSFETFLLNLDKCNGVGLNVTKLKQTGRKLLKQKGFLMEQQVKDLATSYLKPVTLKFSNIDGRRVLEVEGKHIVTSIVLKDIESNVNFFEVEEVRFIKAGVIHIDADLQNAIWHGKNIVVVADTVIISSLKPVVWDVSGKDAEDSVSAEPAGMANNGWGLPGANGSSAESGGNIYILADSAVNITKLRLVSNGGRGGKGQDGGKGTNGSPGNYIDYYSFNRGFPAVAKLSDSKKLVRLQITIESITNDLKSVEKLCIGSTELRLPISISDFKRVCSFKTVEDLKNIYFIVRTVKNNKITFSFFYESLTFCQALLLHEGSEGEEGKPGGAGGLGGKGGFPGDIYIQVAEANIETMPADGIKDGADGIPGARGNPGRSGVDKGYVDRTLYYRKPWPVIYQPHDSQRLKVKIDTKEGSSSVWCPFLNQYAEIKTVREIDKIQQTLHCKNIDNTTSDQQTLSFQASRKKTICPRTMRNRYRTNSSVLTKSLKAIDGLLNRPAVQSKQLTIEVKTMRQTDCFLDDTPSEESITVPEATHFSEPSSYIPNTISVEQIIEIINYDPNRTKCTQYTASWIMKSQLDAISLTQLWDEGFEIFQQDKWLLDLFLDKYNLAVLQQIEQSLSSLILPSGSSKTNCSTSNKRVLSKDDNGSLINDVEKYFVEDSGLNRCNIIELCKDAMNTDSFHMLSNFIVLFMKEYFGAVSENVCKDLEALYGQYQDFIKSKEQTLENRLIPICKDLRKRSNTAVLHVLIQSILENDNECLILFEENLQKDKFLNKLIKCYTKTVKQDFNWKIDCKKPPISKMVIETEFYKFIQQKGPYSACFREFLAFHFNTNILIYSNSENDTLILIDNHNPKADQSVHLLLEEDQTIESGTKFVKLKYNMGLAKVMQEHEIRGTFLSKVMLNVGLLDTKSQLDEFLSKKSYLLKGFKGVHNSEVVKVKISHILSQLNNIMDVAKSFNTKEDVYMITSRLEKLQSKFLGHENILHFMALHFKTVEKHLSARELCFVINLILKFSLEQPQAMPLVSWIFAAFLQIEWLSELAILQLEYTLEETVDDELKNKWRTYLRSMKDLESFMFLSEKLNEQSYQINEKSVNEILHLFSVIPSAHVGLMHIPPMEWKYYLKDKFWAQKLLGVSDWTNEQLKLLSYYILTLENNCGMKACEDLMLLLKNKSHNIKTENDKVTVFETIESLKSNSVNINEILTDLSTSEINFWKDVVENQSLSQDKERTLENLFYLIRRSGNTSESILQNYEEIENKVRCCNKIVDLINIKQTESAARTEEKIDSFMDKLVYVMDKTEAESLLFSLDCVSDIDENTLKKILQKLVQLKASFTALVPFIIKVIEIKLDIILRNTQRVAIMTMLESKQNILAQVSTGEGKSLIVVVLSLLSAMLKKKVNIITSSKVLAVRDAQHYKDVYSFCGISVGHNCSEDIEERKAIYSNCQVIYGELGNFQRDFLLDQIYGKNILGNCTFEVVFVDEVDSMVLDKCNNVLYLSHDIPWLDKLEPVFLFIWNWINSTVSSEELDPVCYTSALKDKLLFEIFGLIKIQNIRDLDTTVEEKQVQSTWNYLVDKKIIDNDGVLVMQNIQDITDALNSITFDVAFIKDHLIYFFYKIVNREQTIHIPNFLHVFVKNHLEEWIFSATTALSMDIEKDYVIDVDRTGTAAERTPNIVILDRDTGSDLVNSQWEKGLHQFLQLKHGTKLSLVSLKAVFISNKSYLNLYAKLYGLTGTLGSTKERNLLKTSYNTNFVTIPTAKKKLFSEGFPLLCPNIEEWASEICSQATNIAKTRSVLIICESVNDVHYLKEKLSSSLQVSTYTRDYESLEVGECLEPGNIIVATNLAGRGTDIKLSQRLVEAKGLHVCLTFMPSNWRVEEQAFGRVARNGQPGSGRMIFKSKLSQEHSTSKVIDLKAQRDMNEIKRLTEINRFHETNVHSEEIWFKKFTDVYTKLKNDIQQDEEIKLILLQSCLNQWAFWLEENSKLISSGPNSLVGLHNSFEKYELMCENMCKKSCYESSKQITEPSLLIKLGLTLMRKKDYSTAFLLFNRVINEEPYFFESALYYKVYAMCELSSLKMADITSDLEKVARQFQQLINSSFFSAVNIDRLKERYQQSILQIEAFKEQHVNLGQLYNIFLESVYKIIGCEITPQVFIIPTIIEEGMANALFSGFVEEGLIRKPKIKAHLKATEFNFVSEYGLIPEQFYQFMAPLGETEFDEEGFLNLLKENFKVPYRELFWEKLCGNKVLLEEEWLVAVDFSKLKTQDPSTAIQLSSLETFKANPSDNCIWLYEPKNTQTSKSGRENCPADTVYNMEAFKTLVGDYKYKFLLKESIIYETRSARHSLQQKNLVFHQFDSICQQDFHKLGVSSTVASNILGELEEKDILTKTPSGHIDGYSLSIATDKIPRIILPRHKQYEEDVKALLTFCFSFRIALEQCILLSEDNSFCNLNLDKNPYLQIIDEMRERNIIINCTVDSGKEITEEHIKNIYPETMTKLKYVQMLSKVYGKEKSQFIVQNLIENGWLERSKQDRTHYTFNTTNRKTLNGPYLNETDTISLILSSYIKTVETVYQNSKTIVNRVLSCQGSSSTVQTPRFSLNPLIEIAHKQHLSSNECLMFSLNSCDQVIDLKDKNCTFQMKTYTSFVSDLLQYGVGLYLFMNYEILTKNGVTTWNTSDLFHAIPCVFSELFYRNCRGMINKLKQLLITLAGYVPSILNKAKSTFGRKLTVPSNVLNENAATNTATKSPRTVIETIVKTVAVHASKATAIGIASATIDNVIEPQLEKLGRLVSDTIYSEIDQSVDCHPVLAKVKDICLRFDEQESCKLINALFLQSVEKHKNTVGNSFKDIADSMSAPILKETSNFFKHNKEYTEDKLAYCVNLCSMLNNLAEVFQQNKKNYFQHFDTVNDILDDLEVYLQSSLEVSANKLVLEKHKKTFYLDSFTSKVVVELKSKLKSVFFVELHEYIVSPVLHSTASVLLSHSFKVLSDKFNYKLCKEEVNDLQKFQKKCLQTVEKQCISKNTTQELLEANYDKCLLGLFNITKESEVFLELFQRSALVDENYIELCCSLIPAVLRKEGIDLPELQVIVDRNGTRKSFLTNESKVVSIRTIYINPDSGLSTNLQRNKVAIGELLKAVITDLIPFYSGVSFTVDALQTLIVKAVEDGQGTEHLFKCSAHDDFNYQANQDETSNARTSPNETSSFVNPIEPTAGIELREHRKLSSLTDIENHVKQGFRMSLKKVNDIVQKHLKHRPKFELRDFHVTDYKMLPNTKHSASSNFHCYPTSYSLVVPLPVTDGSLVDFDISMSLKRESEKRRGPCGTHIAYEVRPKNIVKHWDRICKGYVMLSSECYQQKFYEVKDCLVAGELVLPTFSSINCKVVIIGDSLLKNIYEHTSILNCASKSYESINSLRSNLPTLTKRFKGIETVVLYVGTDLVSETLTEEEIVIVITEIAYDVQVHIKSAKIFVCGLLLREFPAFSHNRKIKEINKKLKDRIVKTNLEYLETNSSHLSFPGINKNKHFPGVRYCSGDGIHLNKRGYQKLSSCLSRSVLTSAKPVLELEQAGNYGHTKSQLFMGL